VENYYAIGPKWWNPMCYCFLKDGNHCVVSKKREIIVLLVPSGGIQCVIVSKMMKTIVLLVPSVGT
jgi:hypothetical protein